MQKQSVFQSRLLPYALVAPQLAIVLIFFYWPAAQAVLQSFLLQDAFGLSTAFIWFENYQDVLNQADYFGAVVRTFAFSFAIALASLSLALLLAVNLFLDLLGVAQGPLPLLVWLGAAGLGFVLPDLALADRLRHGTFGERNAEQLLSRQA